MNVSRQSDRHSDEIDLREFLRVLWAAKWVIGITTMTAAVISVIVALMLPNIYRAEALLAPNEQEGASGLSALAAQYGGLASFAGIDLTGGSADKTTLGIETLKSRKFVSAFVERRDILVPLIASEGWDAKTSDLKIDADSYDTVRKKWVRDVRPPRQAIPTSQEAYKEFMDIMSVNRDDLSGLITVAVEHYSPEVAKEWVDWLVEDINDAVMKQDVAEAEQAIEFLHQQIENTSLAGLKSVFFRLIEEQTKTVMLARASSEYLFRTLDPAVVPELKARPRRSIGIMVATLLTGFFSTLLVLIRHAYTAKPPA